MVVSSAEPAIIFGTTLHGRDPISPYVAEAVGPTILTVPVRVSLKNEQSPGELIQDIYNDSAIVLAHAHLGLYQISRLGPDTRRACDFQHIFLVNNASTEHHHGSKNYIYIAIIKL
ncbi:unnamed protein product [Penicillium camemberti]|uniref:Str. FM013 n=1 Tax=Penicillium camemberti (strain FM 013) TaxID=1429867 RepID=A0A0G4P532_PENC3|nr:unnamed protein product [Penicillium camemberti]